MRCLSSATPGACTDGTVQVTVVDYAPSLVSAPSAVGATMVLSETAYGMISQSSANEINIEFTQYDTHHSLLFTQSYTKHRIIVVIAHRLCWKATFRRRQASFLPVVIIIVTSIRFPFSCDSLLLAGFDLREERQKESNVCMFMVGFFSLPTASVLSSSLVGHLSLHVNST